MSTLIGELDIYMRDTRFTCPEDVETLMAINLDKNRNLAVRVMSFCDFVSAEAQLYGYLNAVKSGEYDYPTMAKLTVSYLISLAHKSKNYYYMVNCHAYCLRAALDVQAAKGPEEYMKLMTAVQKYISHMQVWLDAAIPWKELSDYHTELMKKAR